MLSFLELLARKDISVDRLVTNRFAIADAESAYQLVTGERKEPAIAILLEYEGASTQASRVNLLSVPKRTSNRPFNIGVVGAGQFAKGVLLPVFGSQRSARLHAFCTGSGLTSKDIAKRYNASYCTSDPAEIINDDDIDAVLIATRHNVHAPLTIAALRAGKAVFVEKPLALTEDSLSEICDIVRSNRAARLMVGFNRRFAPLAIRCKEFFDSCHEPMFVQYRVNAGQFPRDSWVFDPVEGGGRIIGELCHFVDTVCYLTRALPERIFAEQIVASGAALDRDSVAVTLRMSNGSVAVIHYMANGDPSVPKEYLEVFGGQRTAILNNYRSLSLHSGNRRRRHRLFNQAKGHKEEIAAFVNALETGAPMPIDFETLVAVTQTTFLVHQSLNTGGPVDYRSPDVS
jgi:polar amino acid transport system substrate-binding protein